MQGPLEQRASEPVRAEVGALSPNFLCVGSQVLSASSCSERRHLDLVAGWVRTGRYYDCRQCWRLG